jgi:hypothetical protein
MQSDPSTGFIARRSGKHEGFLPLCRVLSRAPFGRNFRPKAARPSICGRGCAGKPPVLLRKIGRLEPEKGR